MTLLLAITLPANLAGIIPILMLAGLVIGLTRLALTNRGRV